MPADHVARLLAFLAAEGVLEFDDNGHVLATARTRAMRATVQQQMARMTLETAFAYPAAAATDMTAYEACYGLPVFEHLKANPETARMFGRVMSETTAMNERQIFASHSFLPFERAVDLGGERRGVGGERKRRQGVALHLEVTHELGGEVLRVCRAPAVASK